MRTPDASGLSHPHPLPERPPTREGLIECLNRLYVDAEAPDLRNRTWNLYVDKAEGLRLQQAAQLAGQPFTQWARIALLACHAWGCLPTDLALEPDAYPHPVCLSGAVTRKEVRFTDSEWSRMGWARTRELNLAYGRTITGRTKTLGQRWSAWFCNQGLDYTPGTWLTTAFRGLWASDMLRACADLGIGQPAEVQVAGPHTGQCEEPARPPAGLLAAAAAAKGVVEFDIAQVGPLAAGVVEELVSGVVVGRITDDQLMRIGNILKLG